jgi:Lon protease-like protein
MFPLGVVLFPGAVLPLQVFEPRYRRLVADLPDHGDRFGVVLIRRGHEVGGGEDRYDVGTVADVVDREEVGDGLFLLTAIGRERFKVIRWLDDDPYPRAIVESLAPIDATGDLREAVAEASNARKQLIGIAIEVGAYGQAPTIELPDDPVAAAWMLCNISPIGPYDRQSLLEIDDPVERLRTLAAALNAHVEDLRRALGSS